ncbi:glucose-6-phosphate isomerase [bacterium]|nr:glucose-6-phosphate isomerase [bacterium]
MKINFNNVLINNDEINKYEDMVKDIHNKLHDNCNSQDNFMGWLDLPINYDKEELEQIKICAEKVKNNSKYLLVIGIGGSYLGARAVIEALTSTFYNLRENSPIILYVGNNLSTSYINDIIKIIGNDDFSINVISKSGTTTEPAIAFRIFKKILENKYGNNASERIFVTTDEEKGALHTIAKENNYQTFKIPNNIGGRYSVLTAVGLFPIAVANINVDKLLNGAIKAYNKYNNSNLNENDCYKYAVIRNLLYHKDKNIEIFASYEPRLHYFIEWLKQLFGESEGKNGKGIFPVGVEFTTDLHSLGQYIQDGRRNIFETVLNIENTNKSITMTKEENNLDNLNYLEGLTLDYINHKAMEGTIDAHVSNDVPNILINVDKLDEETIGELIYFFELACAMSGFILNVNPFNQPGVEKYKQNMFKLLNKPGY